LAPAGFAAHALLVLRLCFLCALLFSCLRAAAQFFAIREQLAHLDGGSDHCDVKGGPGVMGEKKKKGNDARKKNKPNTLTTSSGCLFLF
jgi:hypothetical protein